MPRQAHALLHRILSAATKGRYRFSSHVAPGDTEHDAVKREVSLSEFLRIRKMGSERLSNSPEVTQNERTVGLGLKAKQMVWPQSPLDSPHPASPGLPGVI